MYKRQQQDLSLLKQALMGGQISMIEYFVEISVVYQSKTNLLQLENQYQKAMAQIYTVSYTHLRSTQDEAMVWFCTDFRIGA